LHEKGSSNTDEPTKIIIEQASKYPEQQRKAILLTGTAAVTQFKLRNGVVKPNMEGKRNFGVYKG
jgi:hypothetical protein